MLDQGHHRGLLAGQGDQNQYSIHNTMGGWLALDFYHLRVGTASTLLAGKEKAGYAVDVALIPKDMQLAIHILNPNPTQDEPMEGGDGYCAPARGCPKSAAKSAVKRHGQSQA